MFDKIKKFLNSDPGLIVLLVFSACIIGFFISCSESADSKQREHDKEHCVQYTFGAKSSNNYRTCLCYDDEKCAMFIKEVQ